MLDVPRVELARLPGARAAAPAAARRVPSARLAHRADVLRPAPEHARLPRCESRVDIWSSTTTHRHGRKNVSLVPRVVRVVPKQVRPVLVAVALAWLEQHWRGGVYVPDELLPLVSVA
jgi:hypothetical protein